MADPSPSFLAELRRRSVFKVAAAYLAAAFVILQAVDLAVEPLHLPSWTMTFLWVFFIIGFLVALVLAWVYELTREGVRRTEPLPGAARSPLRMRASLAFGLGILVALSGAFVIVWRTGTTPAAGEALLAADAGPAGTAAAGALRPQLVAVAPLGNQTGDATLDPLGPMAADWITHGLIESGVAEVADFSLDAEAVTGATSLRNLARQTGAGIIVSGSYYREGADVLLVARVTDAQAGKVLREIGPVRVDREQPLVGVERLRRLVAGALALQTGPERHLVITGGSPPTYEAYRAYLEGHAAVRRAEFQAALEAYRRAASLDSTFFPAVEAVARRYAESDQCAHVDSIARVVEAKREQISEFNWLGIAMSVAWCRNDTEAAYRVAKRRAELAPGSDRAQFRAALTALHAGRLHEAVVRFQRLDPTRGSLAGDTWYHFWFTDGLHRLGRYEEELQLAERGRAQHPDFVYRFQLGLGALAALGRIQEIEARLQESRRQGASGWPLGTAEQEVAYELAWHGHTDAARQFASRALQGYSRWPAAEQGTLEHRVFRATALLHLARWTEARAVLDSISLSAERLPPRQSEGYSSVGDVLALRGIAAAKSGDGAGAQAALAAIQRLPDSAVEIQYRSREFFEAQVLAAMGREEDALQRLAEGQARGGPPPRTWFVTHGDVRFRDLWHDPRFEAYFAPRD